MSGIFGIEGRPARESASSACAHDQAARRRLDLAAGQLGELANLDAKSPRVSPRRRFGLLDRATYPVIKARRQAAIWRSAATSFRCCCVPRERRRRAHRPRAARRAAHTRAGRLRDDRELAGLDVGALVRTPAAYERLRDAVRSDEQAEEHVEAAIIEGDALTPVIPMIGRRVAVPWRLGDYAFRRARGQHEHPAGAPPRGSLPRPFCVQPERWLAPQSWNVRVAALRRRHPPLPRRGAAMAEQRVVFEASPPGLTSTPPPAFQQAQHRTKRHRRAGDHAKLAAPEATRSRQKEGWLLELHSSRPLIVLSPRSAEPQQPRFTRQASWSRCWWRLVGA